MGNIYFGLSNVAKSVNKIYTGINNTAKEIKKVYAGDENGKARLVFEKSDDRIYLVRNGDYTGLLTKSLGNPRYSSSYGTSTPTEITEAGCLILSMESGKSGSLRFANFNSSLYKTICIDAGTPANLTIALSLQSQVSSYSNVAGSSNLYDNISGSRQITRWNIENITSTLHFVINIRNAADTALSASIYNVWMENI